MQVFAANLTAVRQVFRQFHKSQRINILQNKISLIREISGLLNLIPCCFAGTLIPPGTITPKLKFNLAKKSSQKMETLKFGTT